jgi:hypothetical protein
VLLGRMLQGLLDGELSAAMTKKAVAAEALLV